MRMRYNYTNGISVERNTSILAAIVAMASAGLIAMATLIQPASAATSTVYDATPSTLPPNVASLGFQATSTSEFGDYVHLAGSNRSLNSVTVTMSNWALYSDYATDPRYAADAANWTHPITLNVYSNSLDNDGQPNELLATITQDVTIPWRPEADSTCQTPTAWKADDGDCYNGKAFNAVFNMSSLGATLPDDAIVGVAYNTQSYGATPLATAGPYNSLNVGIPTDQTALVGRDDNANAIFWDTTYPSYTAGFREDSGWAPNGTVAFKITTGLVSATSKDQCKKDGWKTFQTAYKNQGQCVSSVASNKNN